MKSNNYGINELIKRYPELIECKEEIKKAYEILVDCFENNHKLLIAGNGGSCSDSEHIVGELMKSFKKKRSLKDELRNSLIEIDESIGNKLIDKIQGSLPSIALDGHQSLNTAFSNDIENGGLFTYAQQINGYGKKGDVFLGITTSGNSENILYAAVMAKAKGMKVIGLTGKSGGKLKNYADVTIKVPAEETFMVQEYHLPIYHCLCLMLEDKFF